MEKNKNVNQLYFCVLTTFAGYLASLNLWLSAISRDVLFLVVVVSDASIPSDSVAARSYISDNYFW